MNMEMRMITPFMKVMEEKKGKILSQLVCTAYPDGSWNRMRRYGENGMRFPASGRRISVFRNEARSEHFPLSIFQALFFPGLRVTLPPLKLPFPHIYESRVQGSPLERGQGVCKLRKSVSTLPFTHPYPSQEGKSDSQTQEKKLGREVESVVREGKKLFSDVEKQITEDVWDSN